MYKSIPTTTAAILCVSYLMSGCTAKPGPAPNPPSIQVSKNNLLSGKAKKSLSPAMKDHFRRKSESDKKAFVQQSKRLSKRQNENKRARSKILELKNRLRQRVANMRQLYRAKQKLRQDK